jgi:hypothetical protein
LENLSFPVTKSKMTLKPKNLENVFWKANSFQL